MYQENCASQRLHEYEANLLLFSNSADKAFCLQEGTNHIFVSAPHSYEHVRKGEHKAAEPGTGALALMLLKELGCSIAYRTSLEGGDPNWDETSPYRSAVHDAVSKLGCVLLLDLHQLSPMRDVDVNLGINGGRNILGNTWIADFIEDVFVQAGFTNTLLDTPFAASKPQTVAASTALQCGIPSVQIEMNTRYLMPSYEEYDPIRIYDALTSIVRHMEEALTR